MSGFRRYTIFGLGDDRLVVDLNSVCAVRVHRSDDGVYYVGIYTPAGVISVAFETQTAALLARYGLIQALDGAS